MLNKYINYLIYKTRNTYLVSLTVKAAFFYKLIEKYIEYFFNLSTIDVLKRERIILRIILFVVISFFLWAAFSNIDQVVHASGQVIANARTQIIQSSDGGILTHLFVKEGDYVNKGDRLAEFDRYKVEASYNETYGKVLALSLAKMRLQAELNDKDQLDLESIKFEVPQEYKDNQITLFKQRRKLYKDQYEILKGNVEYVSTELGMISNLEKHGDVSKSEVLKVRRQLNDARGALASHTNKYFQDVTAELNKTNEDLELNNQILIEKKQLVDHSFFTSPVEGYVKNIKLTTIGGVLKPGDTLMEILPIDSGFIVETKLPPSKISFVKLGQPVSIKLDAYDYSVFGSIKGSIVYISPDSINDIGNPSHDPRTHSFYRVQVLMQQSVNNSDNQSGIDIKPGMTATVDINTGKRNILSLILKPLTKTLNESFTR